MNHYNVFQSAKNRFDEYCSPDTDHRSVALLIFALLSLLCVVIVLLC
jgi:hypothetical protein